MECIRYATAQQHGFPVMIYRSLLNGTEGSMKHGEKVDQFLRGSQRDLALLHVTSFPLLHT